MKLQKKSLIALLTFLILLSIIIAHFLPPTGILVIPVVISVMIALIIFTDNSFTIIQKSALSYLCIAFNDVGTKLFAGGRHDMESIGWIHMMLFIGLVPCFIMLITGALRDDKSSVWTRILSSLIFVLLMYVHIEIFETLGVAKS